ncbi:MAG: hypothetical protein ABI629_07910 [bacterium]
MSRATATRWSTTKPTPRTPRPNPGKDQIMEALKTHEKRLRSALDPARRTQAEFNAAVEKVNQRNAATGAFIFSDDERSAETKRLRGVALDKIDALNLQELYQATRDVIAAADEYYAPSAMLRRARHTPRIDGHSTDALLGEVVEQLTSRNMRDDFGVLSDGELAPLVRDAAARGDLAALRELTAVHATNVREKRSAQDTGMELGVARTRLIEQPDVQAAAELQKEVDSLASQLSDVRKNVATGAPEIAMKIAGWRAAAA